MAMQGLASARRSEAAGWSSRQTAGAGALAFAVLVGGQNIGRSVLGSPPNGAAGADLAAFFAANSDLLTVGFATVPLAMTALLTFVAAVYPHMAGEDTGAAPWARLGMLGSVFLVVSFSVTALFELALIVLARQSAPSPATAELLWTLHAAAFVFSAVALAITMLGLARACHLSGLTWGWQQPLAAAGAAALLLSGLAGVPSAAGPSLMAAVYPGFIAWLVWLAATGVRLLRG